MYIDTFKLTEPITWEITHDDTADHKFSIRAKIGDWRQMTLGLTEKESEALVEQLGFAIQDYQRAVADGKK